MRANQCTITIERFGKYVPQNYPENIQKISVYCDDYESIYTALSKAYALAVNELAEHERVGIRGDVYTNEFSRLGRREKYGVIPVLKRKYENDVNLEYYDMNRELKKDWIWVYDHLEEIIEVLRKSEDSEMIRVRLKEQFGLDDYQVKKIAQMRFDMFHKEAYEENKRKVEEEGHDFSSKERYMLYQERQKRKLIEQIEQIKAYFVLVDHYEEVMHLVTKTESLREVEKQLCEKFGFTRQQAAKFKYYGINEFSIEEREKKRQELIRLEKNLQYVHEWIESEKQNEST